MVRLGGRVEPGHGVIGKESFALAS